MKRKPSANLQPFEVVAKNPKTWKALEARSPVPTSALIKVGSVCSGMGIDFLALREVLGRQFVDSAVEHTFVCEKNKSASAFLKDNFAPLLFYDDVMSDAFLSAPRVDIFTAGFPCQPFSSAGLGEGEADNQGRGLVIWQIIRYFRVSPPSLFILENVAAMQTRHPATFARIIEELRKIKDAQGEHMFSKPFFKTFTAYVRIFSKTLSSTCACRRTALPR